MLNKIYLVSLDFQSKNFFEQMFCCAYQQFLKHKRHTVEHNKVETKLNMHHILTVFGAYGKRIKPYNTINTQNVADIDGIYISYILQRRKGGPSYISVCK